LYSLCFHLLCNSRGQYVWEDHRPRSGIWKGSNGGEVICFSGCDDHQTSADTSVSFRKFKSIPVLVTPWLVRLGCGVICKNNRFKSSAKRLNAEITVQIKVVETFTDFPN
jgi:hypothetical protein